MGFPALVAGAGDLFRLARRARRSLAASAVVALFAAALELGPYLVVYVALEELVRGTATVQRLLLLALAATACVLGRYVLWSAAMVLSHVAALEVLHDLRLGMADRLARLPVGFLSARRSGGMQKLMGGDADRMELLLARGIPELVSGLGVWLGATVWLFSVDWRMGAASAAVVPVAFGMLALALWSSSDRMMAVDAARARMNMGLAEAVDGMAVLKVFDRSGRLRSRALGQVRELAALRTAWARAFLPWGTAFDVVAVANVVVIVPVALWLYRSGGIDAATLLLFLVVGAGYSLPLLRFYDQAVRLAFVTSAAGRVMGLLEASAMDDTGCAIELDGHSVVFEEVSFAREGFAALSDVNLVAPEGSVTALVGPSGGGKRTIAHLIARSWDADAGRVRIGGVDVRSMGAEQHRSLVSTVFRDVFRFPRVPCCGDTFLFRDTIEANIRAGRPGARADEVIAAARAARAHEFIVRLPESYQTVVDERGSTLSGGERQRIAIARTILKGSPIVVLDEAVVFADPDDEEAVEDAIDALAAGRTVILVAHRLPTVVAADRILVLDEGRVVEAGRHADLIAAGGLYGRMWDAHLEGLRPVLAEAVRRGRTSS